MLDYREWCRLCGALDGSAEISDDILLLIEQLCEIPSASISICNQCTSQFTQLLELLNTTKSLERLFTGLAEENDSDLTRARLNAYRAHFNLQSMIPEALKEEFHENFEEQDEGTEYYIDYLSEENEEEISSDVVDESVVQDVYEVGEEVFYEEESEMIEETVSFQDISLTQKKQSRTEDEAFFTFKCHVCPHPEFQKMRKLEQHCKQCHDCLPLVKCCSDSCNSVLRTWRRLMIHKEKHFPSASSLKCQECGTVYATAHALAKHAVSHLKRFICSHCGKVFKESKTLKWHEATHLKPLEERRSHLCPFAGCDMKFITKQAANNHYESKHQKVISCICSVLDCHRSFFTRKAYHEHMRNTHGERKFFCDQCNFKAKTKSALKTHKEIHVVGESFSCDLCSASFTIYRRLKNHMICHSAVTPFQCQYCEAAFKRSKDLRYHTNIHTKERPFNCQFCTRSFANGANCRKHKIKDHAEELKVWEAENGIGGFRKRECYL